MLDTTTFKQFEGRHVSLALRSGGRLDDCVLLAAPRGAARTVWIFDGGADVFVPLAEILDVWEAGHPAAA